MRKIGLFLFFFFLFFLLFFFFYQWQLLTGVNHVRTRCRHTYMLCCNPYVQYCVIMRLSINYSTTRLIPHCAGNWQHLSARGLRVFEHAPHPTTNWIPRGGNQILSGENEPSITSHFFTPPLSSSPHPRRLLQHGGHARLHQNLRKLPAWRWLGPRCDDRDHPRRRALRALLQRRQAGPHG